MRAQKISKRHTVNLPFNISEYCIHRHEQTLNHLIKHPFEFGIHLHFNIAAPIKIPTKERNSNKFRKHMKFLLMQRNVKSMTKAVRLQSRKVAVEVVDSPAQWIFLVSRNIQQHFDFVNVA